MKITLDRNGLGLSNYCHLPYPAFFSLLSTFKISCLGTFKPSIFNWREEFVEELGSLIAFSSVKLWGKKREKRGGKFAYSERRAGQPTTFITQNPGPTTPHLL